MNITLIGMSGAGKSHIGRQLAEHLDMDFLDLDEVMEREYGMPITEILSRLGDEGFIESESNTAVRETSGKSNLLISTGGSIVYAPRAMEHLATISRIVYLDVPYDIIAARIGESTERLGRIVGLGTQTLRELHDSRIPLYERYAHAVCNPEGMSIEDIVAAVHMNEAAQE